MKIRLKFFLLMTFVVFFAFSANSFPSKKIVQEYREKHERQILKEFMELLSIPNVSSDKKNIQKNAEFIKTMMEKRGIETRIMETKGNPVVFGELNNPQATQTYMFYVHYDGQPVDPEEWTDTQPFEPVLRPGKLIPGTHKPRPIPFPDPSKKIKEDWRIYARGSSDDRAPIIGLLTAVEALQNAGVPLKNLKFIMEGEEEAGSPHLEPFLKKHQDLLRCDVLFMCDGPAYYSGDPTLFFGARGITSMEITVYGPNTSVHSGHYGNWAPNPAVRLSHLLASMRDTDGRVKIKGYYDSVIPLTKAEKEALESIPSYEEEIKKNYGFSQPEQNWDSLLEAIQYPALNVNGIQSGWVGDQARTIIPPSATAHLDIRMVKGNEPEEMRQKVIHHIKEQGYKVVSRAPDKKTRMKYNKIARVVESEKGYKAYKTPMDSPLAQNVIQGLQEHTGEKPVLLPSLGGSLPIYLFHETLGIPIIGIPIANHDNNQHQPDENLRIGHLWTGIETYAAIIMREQE
ncbi:M20/M25/M40 family metallo-hydrolase [bacterium]|nr:M20/M25/M40 family metallo-hydrolase [bacterium]